MKYCDSPRIDALQALLPSSCQCRNPNRLSFAAWDLAVVWLQRRTVSRSADLRKWFCAVQLFPNDLVMLLSLTVRISYHHWAHHSKHHECHRHQHQHQHHVIVSISVGKVLMENFPNNHLECIPNPVILWDELLQNAGFLIHQQYVYIHYMPWKSLPNSAQVVEPRNKAPATIFRQTPWLCRAT